MFTTGKSYSKNDIYEILKVPIERRKGAWDTGYREYEGEIFIFSNVGIPGRTGHDYNNYWDGDLFVWEAKTKSNINQPLIKKMLNPLSDQRIYLFYKRLERGTLELPEAKKPGLTQPLEYGAYSCDFGHSVLTKADTQS
jgi:5-methylcytosine-specific restriction protein A